MNNIDLLKYIEAGFDTLWKCSNGWIVGFFCQGFESLANDGLICFLPLQREPETIRQKYLSPVCDTPQEAILKAWSLWVLAKNKRKNEL
jgi:hypothetical protein